MQQELVEGAAQHCSTQGGQFTETIVADVEKVHKATRIGFLMALVLLVVEFMLGMATNLFVNILTNHPGANPPEYFGGVRRASHGQFCRGLFS